MQPPEFWSGEAEGRRRAPMLQALAAPVSWLYAAGAAARQRYTTPERLTVPVVCIGNLTVGGAGKTPITRAVRKLLGPDAHVISRGYGGRQRGPMRVTPDADAAAFGDEPILHAADGPTWVARDRVAGARAAIAAGARCIILDDGFQNPTLAKDLSLIVVDAISRFGNNKVFPAGPLREPIPVGLQRAQAIVAIHPSPLVGEGREGGRSASASGTELSAMLNSFQGPILNASLAPLTPPPSTTLVAFAGIQRPEKFFATLKSAGAALSETVPFPDHHAFTASDIAWLQTLARERAATLITTEKDFVRLPAAARAEIACFPVSAQFDDPAALSALLAPIAARIAAGE